LLDANKKRVAILANPRAGTGKSHRLVEGLVGALRGRGYAPLLYWQREELSEKARNEGREWRCVVAAGGGGTPVGGLHPAPGRPKRSPGRPSRAEAVGQ